MMTKSGVAKLAFWSAVIAIVVIWSEYHSKLNKVLNIPGHKFELLAASVLVLLISFVSIVTTLVAFQYVKNDASKRKKIVALNLFIFALEVSPIVGLFVFDIEILTSYLFKVITGFGLVLFLTITIPNILLVLHMNKKAKLKA